MMGNDRTAVGIFVVPECWEFSAMFVVKSANFNKIHPKFVRWLASAVIFSSFLVIFCRYYDRKDTRLYQVSEEGSPHGRGHATCPAVKFQRKKQIRCQRKPCLHKKSDTKPVLAANERFHNVFFTTFWQNFVKTQRWVWKLTYLPIWLLDTKPKFWFVLIFLITLDRLAYGLWHNVNRHIALEFWRKIGIIY